MLSKQNANAYVVLWTCNQTDIGSDLQEQQEDASDQALVKLISWHYETNTNNIDFVYRSLNGIQSGLTDRQALDGC